MVLVAILGTTALPGTTFGVQPTLRLSPSAGAPGMAVAATASGLQPRSKVRVVWDGNTSDVAQASADAKGSLQVSFAVPAATPGSHTVSVMKATGQRQLLVSVAFTVLTTSSVSTSPAPSSAPAASPGVVTQASAAPATAPPTSAPTAPPATAAPTPAPTASPTPAPTSAPTPSTTARLLFGLGSQAENARSAAITKAAPIHMLSSWYNGPNDLGWMTDSYHRSIYQSAYSAGFAMHLITWSELPETTFSTSSGTVCGRAYPLSDRWLDDMRQLAQAFGGPASGPTLYVTLLSEFQTYPCIDNAWNPNAQVNNYYKALIAQYTKAVDVFHTYAPNARVSLGWGGWQTRWDEPAIGGGRSMIPYFATAMRAGDVVSFQAMGGDSNVADIRAMTAALGAYGPVMLAHHMPDGDTNSTATVNSVFATDVATLLTATSVANLVDDGLFAWSFLNDAPMRASTTTFALVDAAVTTFGR
jgi:hypothetical protein